MSGRKYWSHFSFTQIAYMHVHVATCTCTAREHHWAQFVHDLQASFLIPPLSTHLHNIRTHNIGIVQYQVLLSGLSCLPVRRRSWMPTLSWTILTSRERGSSNRQRTRQLAMMRLRSVYSPTGTLHGVHTMYKINVYVHDIVHSPKSPKLVNSHYYKSCNIHIFLWW